MYVIARLPCQAVYAPSVSAGADVVAYKAQLANITNFMYQSYNTSVYAYKAASDAGALTTLSSNQWSALNASIAAANKTVYAIVDPT